MQKKTAAFGSLFECNNKLLFGVLEVGSAVD